MPRSAASAGELGLDELARLDQLLDLATLEGRVVPVCTRPSGRPETSASGDTNVPRPACVSTRPALMSMLIASRTEPTLTE